MSVESSYLIRHPRQIPLEARITRLKSAPVPRPCQAMLAFDCERRIRVGATIAMRIPSLKEGGRVIGRVAWLIRSLQGYVVGVAFYCENEAFRMRMLEQVCHIEAYRREKTAREGRDVTRDEAAAEWIARHAADFPRPLPLAA